MTFSAVLWADFLMMHEMCRLAVLVLFRRSVPASELAIGASMPYLWGWGCLFKERGPLMLFTWEQVSKCHFQQFIFHVRIEMSQPSITAALTKCERWNVLKSLWERVSARLLRVVRGARRATNCLFTPESLGVGTKVQMISTHWCKLESQQRQVPSGNVNN